MRSKKANFREVGTRYFWWKFGKVRKSVFLQLFRLYNYEKFIFISCLQLLQKSKSKWVLNAANVGEVGIPFFLVEIWKSKKISFLQSFRLYNYVKFIFISCWQLLQKSKPKCGKKRPLLDRMQKSFLFLVCHYLRTCGQISSFHFLLAPTLEW